MQEIEEQSNVGADLVNPEFEAADDVMVTDEDLSNNFVTREAPRAPEDT